MFYTARQIEDLHRAAGGNGRLVLPYRARLTPLAADWVRTKKVVLGYSDNGHAGTSPGPKAADMPLVQHDATPAGTVLWWCDGPCGPTKAALVTQAKESPLRPLDLPADARQFVPAIKLLAAEIKAGRAAAGVLVVQTAAAAMVYANRCPSLRAVVGTCLEAVEQGVREVAANVLVIEHPHRTLHQVKSMLGRFVKAGRELPEDVRRQLAELASCM